MHPKASIQSFIGTEIEAPCCHKFLGVILYSLYSFGTNFEGRITRFSRSCSYCIFRTVLAEIWHKFRDSLYNIYCWDSRTVVWIRIFGTEIEELFQDCSEGFLRMKVQISLCKFLKMNMM
jgi:hypothetical protein